MIFAAIAMTTIGAVCFMVRFISGPTLGDRAIAIDGFVLCLVAVIVASSIFDGQGTYLVVGLVVTVMGFIATAAVARFIELRGENVTDDR